MDLQPEIISQMELDFAHDPISTKDGTLLKPNLFHSTFSDFKNSSALRQPNLVKTYQDRKKIYLIHATPEWRKIIDSKTIYSSHGCLMNVVYCVQGALGESLRLRNHNFGRYVLSHLPEERRAIIRPIIFEIDLSSEKNSLIGLNYLRLGSLYTRLMEEHRYILPLPNQEALNQILHNGLTTYYVFLEDLWKYSSLNDYESAVSSYNIIVAYIQVLPFLSFFLFESVSATLMILSSSKETSELLEEGELNTELYIALQEIVAMCSSRFSVNLFMPTFQELSDSILIMKEKFCLKISHDNFFITLITSFRGILSDSFPTSKVPCENSQNMLNKNLEGQLFYYFLQHTQNAEYKLAFNRLASNETTAYWDKKNVLTCFNSVLPKGELGLNSFKENHKVKCYLGCYSDKFKSVEINEEVIIKISTR